MSKHYDVLGIFRSMRYPILILAALTFLVTTVCATDVYATMTNVLTFKDAFGHLIPLGIENFVTPTETIMYYNYISIALLVVFAGFAGQGSESRFTFMVPLFAAGLVFIGWLQASDPTTYWGMIVGCILLGALMYVNDMNREKNGVSGPGSKLLTIVFMIIVFEAGVTLMATPGFNLFPDLDSSAQGQHSLTCGDQQTGGYGYQCDASGNMMFSESVTTISNAGGSNLNVVSITLWSLQALLGAITFLIKIVGAVLLFSVVLYAAYPALAASPQAIAILALMQVVIWAIYSVAFFNWYAKPTFETAAI